VEGIVTKVCGAVKPASWAKFGLYGFALTVVYYSALRQMIGVDWEKEDFNYCYLIPFVVLYFIWEKRDGLAALASQRSWGGLPLLCLGLFLFWIGELAGEFFSLYISFWLVIVGLVWLHLGWEKLKTIWFPMAMMLAMFPLPDIVNVRLTFGLKLISSQIGVAMLQLYGMSAYREGNVIDLGFTQLQVVEACAGLRYLMPLLVLSLILAYWYRVHIWKRIFLVLSSIPIAIFVNSFRIAATGVLFSVWGAPVAEGFFHGFAGWLIFMGTIPVLLAEMWVLGKLPPRGDADRGSRIAEVDSKFNRSASGCPENPKSSFFSPVFIVAVVLLGSTLILSKTIEFREKIPIKRSFKEFPVQVGEWSGSKGQMEQQFIDALHFTDYAMADYRNPQGKSINFYTAYYESQRKGEATHSPETCLPGAGWLFREAGTTNVPLGPERSMPVKRAFMEKSGQRELTYYWFAMRGRTLTNLYQVKLYTFWDALTKHRTDGALVRLITPVYDKESVQQAEARLQEFTKEIVPVLREYIPE
jgi:exosortase D (VPLPA-CTERM-specific)